MHVKHTQFLESHTKDEADVLIHVMCRLLKWEVNSAISQPIESVGKEFTSIVEALPRNNSSFADDNEILMEELDTRKEFPIT